MTRWSWDRFLALAFPHYVMYIHMPSYVCLLINPFNYSLSIINHIVIGVMFIIGFTTLFINNNPLVIYYVYK